MVLEYLPTKLVDFWGFYVGKYSIHLHGASGIPFFRWTLTDVSWSLRCVSPGMTTISTSWQVPPVPTVGSTVAIQIPWTP